MTPRQKDTLEFIAGFLAKNGYAPSFEEIAEGIGVASIGTVAKRLEGLKRRGMILVAFNQSRSIELTPKGRSLLNGKSFRGSQVSVTSKGRFFLLVRGDKGTYEKAGELKDIGAAIEQMWSYL